MFILDVFTPNLSVNSNSNIRRTGPVPNSNQPVVDNSSTTLPASIDSFTSFESHDLLYRVPPHQLDPTLRELVYGDKGIFRHHYYFYFWMEPRDIDPGFNPNRPVFPIEPRNPWEGHFPRPAPPSDQEMIKGLDRIDSLIDFVINSTEINGVNPRMLDKAHKVIKERLKKLTKGLDLETRLRIQEELDEAFEAAHEGDLSKIEAFQEKLKKIKEGYNNQPRIVPLDIPCGRRPDPCEMSSPPVTAVPLNQIA